MAEVVFACKNTDEVRKMARDGQLAEYAESVTGDAGRRLWALVYEIIQPVVFQRVTRKLEIRRGHMRCAASFRHLDDACLDNYHDDVHAVIEHVLHNARMPILDLERWVAARLTAATVDGYRRRRSARGALQRPRIPRWLAARLGDEERLLELAVEMLEFVGNDVSAGLELWPTDRWAEKRALSGIDHETAHRMVLRDIQAVLAAMHTRPSWYEAYVERPLGCKRLPTLPLSTFSASAVEEVPVFVAGRTDREDAALVEKAALAVDSIKARVARGEEPTTVIPDVVARVFEPGTGSDDLDQVPGAPRADEWISAGLVDRGSREQLTAAVLAMLSGL